MGYFFFIRVFYSGIVKNCSFPIAKSHIITIYFMRYALFLMIPLI